MITATRWFTVITWQYFNERSQMALGKLFQSLDDEFIVEVDYRFYNESDYGWWGELVFTEYKKVANGDGYVLELKDGRRGHCSLTKKINKAVSGIPPLYYYRFQGHGAIE